MSGRMLLVADDASFAKLRAHSDLPSRWLIDTRPETAVEQAEGRPPRILRCRHKLILPVEDGAQNSPLDTSDRAEFINSFLDATICYLAVVGSVGGEPAEDGEEAAQSVCPRSLLEHVTWYHRFRGEVRALAKAREIHVRHVLVLVCCDEVNTEDFAHFDRLVAGSSDAKLFDAAYVMLHELEPGRKVDAEGALLLSAEHVWPMAVGDLLLKLLHDEEQPQREPTRTFAWRSYELVPEIPGAQQQELFAEQFDRLYFGLTDVANGGRSWDVGPFTSFKPRSGKVQKPQLHAPDAGRNPLRRSWLAYSAVERLDETRAVGRWENGLSEAGDAVARELSRMAVGEEPAAGSEVGKIWQAVHGNPHAVYAALGDREVMNGRALGDEFETISEHWDKIRAAEQCCEDLVQEAEACAEHFTQAQNGHLNWLYRIIVLGVVTLAVGYLSMAVFEPLAGMGRAFWVAMAGAVGAMIAAMYSFDRERAAGRRAQETFEDQLQRIDRAVIDRHEACQAAVEHADVLCQQTRAAGAARRLRQLLRRVQSMLDHELRPRMEGHGSDAVGVERLLSVEDPAEKGLVAAQRQRLRYAQATRLGQVVDLEDLQAVRQDDEIRKFVDDQVATFRDDVWMNFCLQHDRGRAGHLPARQLIPILRAFRDEFQKSLTAKIRELAIRRFRPKDLSNWGKRLRDALELQPYFELMSCRMLSHQTADKLSRPWPRLYVRKDFDATQLSLALDGSQIQDEPEASPLLVELPMLGLLFQEMPVQFETDADGKVIVAAYREKEHVEPPLAGEPAAVRRDGSIAVQNDDSPPAPPDESGPVKRRRRPK